MSDQDAPDLHALKAAADYAADAAEQAHAFVAAVDAALARDTERVAAGKASLAEAKSAAKDADQAADQAADAYDSATGGHVSAVAAPATATGA